MQNVRCGFEALVNLNLNRTDPAEGSNIDISLLPSPIYPLVYRQSVFTALITLCHFCQLEKLDALLKKLRPRVH